MINPRLYSKYFEALKIIYELNIQQHEVFNLLSFRRNESCQVYALLNSLYSASHTEINYYILASKPPTLSFKRDFNERSETRIA